MGSRIVKTTRGNCGSAAAMTMMDVRCINVGWSSEGFRHFLGSSRARLNAWDAGGMLVKMEMEMEMEMDTRCQHGVSEVEKRAVETEQ